MRTPTILAPLLACAVAASVPGAAGPGDPIPPPREAFAHASPVQRLALSPDGKVLVTAAQNAAGRLEIKAWSTGDETPRWATALPGSAVVGLCVGEELVFYAYAGVPAPLHLALADGKESLAAGLPAQGTVSSIACTGDRWAWLGTELGLMRIAPDNLKDWSTRGVEHGGVTCLAADEGGKKVAIGCADGVLLFAKASNASIDDKKPAEGHTGPVTALAFDAKGKLVASGSEDGTARVWTSSGQRRLVLGDASAGGPAIDALAFDPKGGWLATGDRAGTVRIWSLDGGEKLAELTHASQPRVVGLAVLGKGKALASAGGTSVVLWDLSSL